MEQNPSDILYKLNSDNQSLTLVKYPRIFTKEIIIPKYHNYLPITKIGSYAFANFQHVEKIILPETVTEIGEHAFESCMDLTTILIPASVVKIGDSAFSGCTYLWNFKIPDSVEYIGYNAFFYCPMISNIYIPQNIKTIEYEAFGYCTDLKEISVSPRNSKYASIEGNLYSKDGKELIQYSIGKKDTTFIVPQGVHIIGSSALYQCKNLKKVTIPSSVVEIHDRVFLLCSSLKSIHFDDTSNWKVSKSPCGDYGEIVDVSNDKINVEKFGKIYHFHFWRKE